MTARKSKPAKASSLGEDLIQSLTEAVAWKQGKVALATREIDAMPAERIKRIRKAVAKSPRDFEQRFRIPARTMENWEQGHRKPDITARILLTVIESAPETVEKALAPK
jgi:putative transcriptional regulator